MAGPYHAAQSPEPFAIPVPIGTLGLTCLHCQSRLPVCPIQACTLSHEPKPAVLTRASPAIKLTNTSPTIHFARPRYITPSSAFSNQGRLKPATFSSDTSQCLPYQRFRSSTELIVPDCTSFFPSSTLCIWRHPQIGAARPQICQEANPSPVLFCLASMLPRLRFGRCNIEFSCPAASNGTESNCQTACTDPCGLLGDNCNDLLCGNPFPIYFNVCTASWIVF
jgi:hypothetical protein